MKRLTVFVGPVHSEKSTKAAHIAVRYQRLGYNVVLLRPRCSVRSHEQSGTLVTKNGVTFPSIEFDSLTEIEKLASGADVIWFDEIMLAAASEPKLQGAAFEAIQRLRRKAIILVSGLSATSELEPFTLLMAWLLAVADHIVQCHADCDLCGEMESASRSVCLIEKNGQVLVGGEETYKAACPECWTKHAHAPATATL